jgi:hypothetical protein
MTDELLAELRALRDAFRPDMVMSTMTLTNCRSTVIALIEIATNPDLVIFNLRAVSSHFRNCLQGTILEPDLLLLRKTIHDDHNRQWRSTSSARNELELLRDSLLFIARLDLPADRCWCEQMTDELRTADSAARP